MSIEQTIQNDLKFVFSEAGDFIDAALHTHPGGSETINIIFDQQRELMHEGNLTVTTSEPSIMLKTFDMTNVSRESVFKIDGVDYNVFEIQPDDKGVTIIILTLDSNK